MQPLFSLSPELLRRLLDAVADGIYFVNTERRVTYWNPAAERITGFPAESILGQSCGDGRLMHCDRWGKMLCRQGCPLTAVLEGSEVENHEMYVRCRDGSRRPVAVTATPVRDEDGRIVGAVEAFRDNREKLAVEEERDRALRLACLDALTGVANRRRMERTLENYLAEGYVARAPGVLLLLDVDHFKKVNDTYGHGAGDAVLRTVARTLEGCVRVGDTVGRWGGEEFVVLLAATTREQGKEIAERLRCQVERTVTRVGEQEMGERGIGERGIVVTCSVGGAEIQDGDTVRTLVRRSDEQMYRAKNVGRNRVCFAEGGQAGRGEAEGSETEGGEAGRMGADGGSGGVNRNAQGMGTPVLEDSG